MNNSNAQGEESIFSKITNYVTNYIELKKLSAIEKLVLISSSVIVGILVAIVSLMVLFFMSVGLALYLGVIFGVYYLGFLAVGGIYAVFLIFLILISKKHIHNPLTNLFIQKIFKK
ncbi:hypothetical protein [Pedobacter alpinus]|uniref:Holin-X, holin superfamily III n=1 Tax=Pedobacter alpinus TaxID=1590643 RepID=A0ABW5TRK0_9SPHI